ncbi:uncharacterized protein V1513DRAFT_435728 [Lipomyces chichibuensis]|uniref:uncharacterized protein n=1 Tax=Lipomyces chichibuensis TaxID=1546026 RepID=UPI003343E0F7
MALVHIPQLRGCRPAATFRPGVSRDIYSDLQIPGSTLSCPKFLSSNTDDLRDKKAPISVRILGNNGVGKLSFAEEILNISTRDPTYIEAVDISGDDAVDDEPCSALLGGEYGRGDRIFTVLERWRDVRLRCISAYAKKGHITIKKDIKAVYFGVENQVYVLLPTWATADKNEDKEIYKENVIILVVDATKPELNNGTLFKLEYFLRQSPVSRIIIAVNKMDLVVESFDSDHAVVSANAHKGASAHGSADISATGDAPPSHKRFAIRRPIPPNDYWRDLLRFGPESRFKEAVEIVRCQIRKIESKHKGYESKPVELVSVPTVAKNGANVDLGVFSQLCHWYQQSTVMELLARKGDS